jgi:aromatic ring-opening dioxygenase LigB subunit
MSGGYTGVVIEPHGVLPDREMGVVYQDGKRVACFYYHPNERLIRVIYESDKVRMSVMKRIADSDSFVEEDPSALA